MPTTANAVAAHVALVAPVPLIHLQDGLVVCKEKGKVAFGSNAFDVWQKLEKERHGLPVDVYIYASHAGQHDFEVSWHATYINLVAADRYGCHPDRAAYRPASCEHEDNAGGGWGYFWEVEDLRELLPEERMPLSDFTGFGKPKGYGHAFPPEGPLLVEHP